MKETPSFKKDIMNSSLARLPNITALTVYTIHASWLRDIIELEHVLDCS